MSLKKLLGVISIVVVVMFVFMLTTSYAWYSFEEGSTTFDVVTNNDDVIVTFQQGEYIATNIAVPITTTQIDQYSSKNNFNIKLTNNKTNNEVLVTISLVEISIDDALKDSNFKVDLYYQNTLVKAITGVDVGTNTEIEFGNVTLTNDIANNFEFRVYILDANNTIDQSAMMNKSFQAKIKVDVVSRLKSSMNDFDSPDITVTSITIDGESASYLPTSGYYNMSATCIKGSTLTWEPFTKTIIYDKGSKINDSCSLTFTKSTDTSKYPLLNTMEVGSYVAYVGNGGTVGNGAVVCQKNGDASSSTATNVTEAPNSCYGQNAREDLETTDGVYGYCYDGNYKYYTTGWRIAYIDSNNKPVIVSAGSPECNTRDNTENGNTVYIQTANAKALKYCNTDYVDGDCTCTDSDDDGLCDSASSDAWAINDTDFYYMTKAISGVGKRLTSDSSSLGDSGGTLGSTLYCYDKYSYQECGYNNDLIDNGGFYWFAAQYSSSNAYGVTWYPLYRSIGGGNSFTYAYGLRPVISLSSSVYVTGGSGTMEDPYTIGN